MGLGIELAWSAPVTELDGSRDTADPLGFRGWVNQLARDLVPGLTQATSRTRGYSLLCKGLQLARSVADRYPVNPVDAFLRFERLWVGAQRAVHEDRARWVGIRMASVLLDEPDYRLDRALTSQQLYSGLWGGYRRSATAFGLIEPVGRHSGPAGCKPTARGSELAGAVTRAAFTERVQLANHILKESLPKDFLTTLIAHSPPGDQPDEHEVRILSSAIRDADRFCDRALQRLRQLYDQRGGEQLSLDSLVQPGFLSPVQQRAAAAAQELYKLMEAIEQPYRLWVTGWSVEPISPAILEHPGWETARRWPVAELVALHKAMRHGRTAGDDLFEAIHGRHMELMEERGAEPWERGVETPARRVYQAPDFCLTPASRLFAEGVLGGEV